jgi:chromosomal replication initiator protein
MQQNREDRVSLIWDEFLKIIKEEAGVQIVETWFKAVCLEEWDPSINMATLRVPNQFVSKWIQEHYTDLLKKHLARLLHTSTISLNFICKTLDAHTQERTIIPASVIHNHHINQEDSDQQDQILSRKIMVESPKNRNFYTQQRQPIKTSPPLTAPPPRHTTPAIIKTRSNIMVVDKKSREQSINNLNEKYHFSSFIVGPSNSLAHAAAYAICENIGKVYNPLFIYGGTGLGKTHLMHAIGNEVRKQHPNLVIRYETSDHFINEFINCIRFDRSHYFRTKYQKVDLLMLDDIQFLSNKEQTQETFFHIFNTLYEQQKQIVLSSDTFPKEIHGLQNRLKSRMEWGLVADIQMPDLETKIAILKKKADGHNITLDDEVADFIASRVLSNIRELEGALIRVSAFSSLTSQPITIELARRVLLNLNEKKKDGIMLEDVIKVVAKHYATSVNEIKSKSRQQDIATVRQVALYMMKKLTFSSLQTIGSFVGGRDHSTVIHAITKIEQMMLQDPGFVQKIKQLEQDILTQ